MKKYLKYLVIERYDDEEELTPDNNLMDMDYFRIISRHDTFKAAYEAMLVEESKLPDFIPDSNYYVIVVEGLL
jgi:hypothetical protein